MRVQFRKEITRWSLSSLASFDAGAKSARLLLNAVGDRLSQQQVRLDQVETLVDDERKPKKYIQHLRYIHVDTERLCRQLLPPSSGILRRWDDTDRCLVSNTFAQVRDRHAATLETLVDIVESSSSNFTLVGKAMCSVARARWGIQLLCDHFVQLDKGTPHGAVSVDADLADIVDEAIIEARHVCEAHWMTYPQVIWDDAAALPPVTLVRSWVNHVLVEVLKNGMHASVRQAKQSGVCEPPVMHLEFAHDTVHNTLTVDVIDNGIGLSVDKDPEAYFELGYSAEKKRWDRLDEQQSYARVRSPMSSLGVGLTVSRRMMRQFGGDVVLIPEHVGCRARIVFPLDSNILEREPDPIVMEMEQDDRVASC